MLKIIQTFKKYNNSLKVGTIPTSSDTVIYLPINFYCTKIFLKQIDICGRLGYKQTGLPNLMGHQLQVMCGAENGSNFIMIYFFCLFKFEPMYVMKYDRYLLIYIVLVENMKWILVASVHCMSIIKSCPCLYCEDRVYHENCKRLLGQ